MRIGPVTQEQAWAVRHEVMWPDRAPEYVRLDNDGEGEHYGVFVDNPDGGGETLVSVVSLFREETGAQFRKFATLVSCQGQGYGSLLLSYVLNRAAEAGARRVFCNARSEKAGFYRKFGLEPTGEAFTKGGKEYVIMERRIGVDEGPPPGTA